MKKIFLAQLITLCCGVLFSIQVLAVSSDANSASEQELIQKVRTRSYPGGSDESDLKVQSQLSKPIRKISPTTEDSSEPAVQE